jgi:hypothetical protein
MLRMEREIISGCGPEMNMSLARTRATPRSRDKYMYISWGHQSVRQAGLDSRAMPGTDCDPEMLLTLDTGLETGT